MSVGVVSILDPEFESEVLQATEPLVVVYFWASWCGPCRLLSPTMEWAAQTYSDRLKIVKMEVDPNPTTVATYKVEGVPALRLFQQVKLVNASEGAISKEKLVTLLETYLP